jgi:hypothetical protein
MGLVVVVLAVVAALALVYYSSEGQRMKRQLALVAVRPIAELTAGGVARVTGTLRYLKAPLTAPVTSRACAFYRVTVSERRGKHWRQVLDETSGTDFLVSDASGTLLVRPANATVHVVRDGHASSGTFESPTPEMTRLLGRHGQSARGMLFNRTLRFHEGVLAEGETVTVAGRVRREPDETPGATSPDYRSPPTRPVLAWDAAAPLLITDDPAVR